MTNAQRGGLALIDQAVVSGARFLTTIMIGRACGADGLGVYSLAFSLLLLSNSVHGSLLWLPLTVRLPRLDGIRRGEYAGSVLIHFGLLSVLATVALAVVALAFSASSAAPQLVRVIWLLAAMAPFLLLRELAREFAFADLNLVKATAIDVVMAALQVGGLLGLAAAGLLSPASAYAVTGLACAVSGVGWLLLSRGQFRIRRRCVRQDIWQDVSFGKWVLATRLSETMNGFVILWLLAFMLDQAAAGMFAACMSVVTLSNPLVLGINNVLTPTISGARAKGGLSAVRNMVWKASLLMGLLMGAFCVFVLLFGGEVLWLLYGDGFAGNHYTIAALALALLTVTASTPCEHGLWALESPKDNFKARLLGLCMTSAACVCFIRQFGVPGAALGLLAGNAVVALVTCFAYRTVVNASCGGPANVLLSRADRATPEHLQTSSHGVQRLQGKTPEPQVQQVS